MARIVRIAPYTARPQSQTALVIAAATKEPLWQSVRYATNAKTNWSARAASPSRRLTHSTWWVKYIFAKNAGSRSVAGSRNTEGAHHALSGMRLSLLVCGPVARLLPSLSSWKIGAVMTKPHCEHCGKETAVECWDCASVLNPVVPQVIIDGLKSVKKIASVMIPNTISYEDWEAAWDKHDAAMAYLEKLNAKTPA